MSQLKGSQEGGVPCYSVFLDLQLTGLGPPTLGREIALAKVLNLILILPKNILRHPQSIWSNICAACGPVNLTHKINHHSIYRLLQFIQLFIHCGYSGSS